MDKEFKGFDNNRREEIPEKSVIKATSSAFFSMQSFHGFSKTTLDDADQERPE
jgi:hypothetical protein